MRTASFHLLALLLCLSVTFQGAPHLHAEEILPPLHEQHEGEKEAQDIWTCSMHPQIQLPEPGQCPICFMDLIKIVLDSGAKLTGLRQISFSENARRLAQVEVTPVSRGDAATSIHMVGKVDFDETLVSTITAWINGRIDKLHVAYTGARVRAGQPMAEIYSPELLTAQAELIEATAASRKMENNANPLLRETVLRTAQAARKKLQLLGLTREQIDKVLAKGAPSDHVTLTAPISGIVIDKKVNEGMYVKTGMPIYTIADLDRLWVILEAYESDLHGVRMGQQVAFSAEALPGQQFSGEVNYIDPLVNEKTRTVRVRLSVDNQRQQLKPGMFVRAVAQEKAPVASEDQPLLIPASAPLITGKRALVYVQVPDMDGVYEGREITLGPRRGDFYEVGSGLAESELVVSRGNFKIDSAVQIQARPSMMNPYRGREAVDRSEIPPLAASRLNLLNDAFIRLSAAVHAKDPAAQGESLDSFAELLAGIQADALGDANTIQWKEFSMLLASDVVLLREADSQDELRLVYAEMASHFHQVRTTFHLGDTSLGKEGPDELRAALGKLLAAYLSLQKNLAADAEEKSVADIQPIVNAAAAFTEELNRSGADNPDNRGADLSEALRKFAGSRDIAQLRTAFYPLSKTIIEAVATYGVTSGAPVYEHYCPMAFENTGATWLDTSEEISNPYFGTQMLRCGEVQRQFSVEE